jgi:hypothetical protein
MATNLHREPWNKGITVDQNASLKLKEVGRFVCAYNWLMGSENSRCLLWA